jgi:hypothetical protein
VRAPVGHRLVDRRLDLGQSRVEPVSPRRLLVDADSEQLRVRCVRDDAGDVVTRDSEHLLAQRHGLEIELVDGVETVRIVDRQRLARLGKEQDRDDEMLALAGVGAVDDVEVGAVALAVEKLLAASLGHVADSDADRAGAVGIPVGHSLRRPLHGLVWPLETSASITSGQNPSSL